MISLVNSIVGWFSDIFVTIVNLSIPFGANDSITIGQLSIFMLLLSLSFKVVKMFLTKSHLSGGRNGKD